MPWSNVITVSAPAGDSPAKLTARTGSLSAKVAKSSQPSSHCPRSLSRLTIVRLPAPAQFSRSEFTLANGYRQTSTRRRTKSSPSVITFASATFAKPGKEFSLPSISKHPQVANTLTSMGTINQLSPVQIYGMAKKASQANFPSYAISSRSSSFIPLTGDTLFPFIDRPAEVAILMSDGRNARFLKLFSEILLTDDVYSQERSTAELFASQDDWSFRDFKTWMGRVSREEMDDLSWSHTLQVAIFPRSAALWERLKDMLGIPSGYIIDGISSDLLHQPGRQLLNITPIFPTSFGPASRLNKTPEETRHTKQTQSNDQIMGLRISNLLASISEPASPSSAAPPLSRPQLHSPKSFVPSRHSPLVPRSQSALGTIFMTGCSRVEQHQETSTALLRTRPAQEAVYARFPASFDKLTFRHAEPLA